MGDQVARALSALRRYKWLLLAIVIAGSSVGLGLTRFMKPTYDVNATIWIAENKGGGAISSPGLISNALAWPELARSFIVLDGVVSKLALYVQPSNLDDTTVVRSLLPSDSLRPGPYALRLDPSGSYSLLRRPEQRGQEEVVVEQGMVGDSVGRTVGFLWQPPAAQLAKRREIRFDVITPREASLTLNKRLSVSLPENSNLMRLSLSGEKPALLATEMNALLNRFLQEAARLKKENLRAIAATVDSQLVLASKQLTSAESALETFKINTITLPSENTPVAPGVSLSLNPVFSSFFAENIAYKTAIRDREALQSILEEAERRGGRISVEALKTLPGVLLNNTNLNTEVTNLAKKETELRQLQVKYTDEYQQVKDLRQQILQLETQTIPSLARVSLEQLQRQEADLKRRIEGASSDLKQIPARTIEEARRMRDVDIAAKIFMDLQSKTAGARLAEMSALPDIAILDSAVAPRRPTSDTAPDIILVAVAASIGVAIALSLLLDRMDKRFRYPEQATNQLGLDVVGAIPSITNPRNSSARLQEASQLVEAFRALSLSVRSAFNGLGPIQFTVSSPGPGDGKSFVSANLASALADGGCKTLLIDGDIRRGALHSVFAPMEQAPGLLEYLAGASSLSEVIHGTQHGNLFVLPTGARRRHGPELLASEAMIRLIREVRDQFDAVVVDSAPFAAGIDAFALGVATGSMLIVLRTGETDRKMAQAKLEVLDRMPVRVLGAVLNDIGESPQFKYYQYYLEGYESSDSSSEHARLTAGNGARRSG
jgi:tyrosine-protein kinase Etk/Wzc